MEHGRIVTVDSHDALVRSNPLYARLAALQFAVASNEELAADARPALQ